MTSAKSSKFTGVRLARLIFPMVIAGLIIGCLLVGISGKHESEILKGMSQFDKFKEAAKTFDEKYGYLPGDIPAALALQLKFTPRNGGAGRGDGNGLLEGASYPGPQISGVAQSGENLFFWEDLFSADLIKDSFRTAMDAELEKNITDELGSYLPDAGLRPGDRIYVYSYKNSNYLGVSAATGIEGISGSLLSHPGLSVREAYDIDKKIDDGEPNSGQVLARYVNRDIQEALIAPKPSPASCADKTTGGYSLSQDNGAGINCGLSFVLMDR